MMIPHLRRLLLLPAALGVAGSVRALEWNTTAVEVHPAPFQTAVDLVFGFHNAGNRPVSITDIQTNCHCIGAEADKKVYQPGESGRITAHFEIGDRYGLYERTISVASDDSPEAEHLTARIDVPDVATVTPLSLEWRVGGARVEQSVEIRAGAGLTIQFRDAVPTNDAFAVRLEPVEAGRIYRLFVIPRDTARPANAAIRIRGREKSGHDVLVSAYANLH